jgi:UDPglucose--hexose-1-phosphate uridylyltransferase
VPELRFDPLRQEWVAYNTDRNDRTFLPTSFCPLCPSGAGGDSEIQLDDFEVVVFENRFPAIRADKALHTVRVQASAARSSSTQQG